jgi:hypothetical protein
MNRLVQPQDPEGDPIEVPCLSLEDYDGGFFMTYPKRKGYSISGLFLGDYRSKPLGEVVSFAQTWLYFSLLSEFLGSIVRRAELFAKESDGKTYVNFPLCCRIGRLEKLRYKPCIWTSVTRTLRSASNLLHRLHLEH